MKPRAIFVAQPLDLLLTQVGQPPLSFAIFLFLCSFVPIGLGEPKWRETLKSYPVPPFIYIKDSMNKFAMGEREPGSPGPLKNTDQLWSALEDKQQQNHT